MDFVGYQNAISLNNSDNNYKSYTQLTTNIKRINSLNTFQNRIAYFDVCILHIINSSENPDTIKLRAN